VAAGDAVLDIGSNDATSLKAYATAGLRRTGMDPTGRKFQQYYPEDITLVPDFFSAKAYLAAGGRPAKVATSIAMFYDLEDPVAFARQVEKVLAPGGVWHLEQSYMPSMLRLTSYDTVCHEHLEYYSLGVIKRILEAADLRAVDVKMNAVNGGSFAVTAVRKADPRLGSEAVLGWLLEQEGRMGLDTPRPYRDFEERVYHHRADLMRLLKTLAADGKRVLGYGASTKGNVLLQFCGVSNGGDFGDRRGEPRQVRHLHPGYQHPDRVRGRSAGDEARLLPGPALALQGWDRATRSGVPR